MTISRSFANLLLVPVIAAPLAAQSAGPLQIVPSAQITAAGSPHLGRWVSLSGDDLLVRDYAFANANAFVFHRSSGAWSQQATLPIRYTYTADCTGFSTGLSISGNRLAIGEAFNGSTGQVTVSERVGSTWGPPAYIEDQNVYGIGSSVLLNRGLLILGAPDDPFFGVVEVWRKQASGWQWTAGLPAPPQSDNGVGTLLAVSGNTLLVASRRSVHAYLQGATPADWTFQANLVPQGDAVVQEIAIDGDVAVVSTRPTASCGGSPELLVFERSGTSWSQTTSLVAADSTSPELGTALVVAGDTIWVGASTHSEGSSNGAVYVFQRLAGAWTQTAKLFASPALGPGLTFGSSLAKSGTTLCVGAPGSGEVQVFDVVSLPPPSTYCTAKVNSLGCLPQMSASGVPGFTNPNPFLLRATNVMNNKVGILLYSTAGSAATPFQGGILCIAGPFRRTPGQMSGGNPPPNDCSGTYSFDFNARVRSGVDPALVPGRQVWAQYYSRDPGDPFFVGLTDAVTFTIGS